MVDSIELFDQICNNLWFRDCGMILFLNKKDLFAEKIQSIPITDCPAFETFTGNTKSYDGTTDYIREIFENCNQFRWDNREISTHLTCATDKNRIVKVLDDIYQ
eukprot:40238_1